MSVIDNIIGFASTFTRPTVKLTKDQYLHHISTSYIHYLYLKYWKYTNDSNKIRMLLATSFAFLSVYVFAPTLKYHLLSTAEKEKMFSSKRKDKLTIGLVNTRNDCFANSAIQAFASMPGLNLYLNEVIKQHETLLSLKDSGIKLKEGEEIPKILLHEGLAQILKTLQEPITSTKNASVWPFLRVIEQIYSSRISTSQNDAHELVQLILETLDTELVKFIKFTKEHSHEIGISINVPEFPFNGLLADQLTCLSCSNSSKPSFYPFSVLSLPVPSAFVANLKEMIRSNEVETITGYNCLRCRIEAILKLEDEKALNGVSISEECSQFVSKLKIMETNLFINDDLEEELETFVKNYESNGFRLDNLSSTIVKKTLVIKSPNLLTIHLSRSLFIDNRVKRNNCHVAFDEILDVNIDESLASAYEFQQRELKKKDKKKKGDAQSQVTHKLNPVELVRSHSKILTQTQEIEYSVHHEEITSTLELNTCDGVNTQSLSSTPPSDSSVQSNKPNTSVTDVTSIGSSDLGSQSSSNSSIISEQLNMHNNTVIRYKLKAMIRHQGTHNAGHYECYRHKPEFMKDTVDDIVVNLSPSIRLKDKSPAPATPETNASSPLSSVNEDIGPKDTVSKDSITKAQNQVPLFKKLESSSSPVVRGLHTPFESTSRASESETDDTYHPQVKERRRSKFSNFVSQLTGSSNASRRGSTININTDDHLANIVESNLSLVNDTGSEENSVPNGSASSSSLKGNGTLKKIKNPEKRYKNVSSVSKKPFWRISDTTVNEVRMDEVLKEKGYVYMIYYEKI